MVGDGTRISFWEDTWCGDMPLCEAFPFLFALACSKRGKVDEVWDLSRGEGAWMPIFVIPFNDWELDIVQNYFCLINSRSVNQMEKDNLHWKGGKNGMYTVKESYELLVGVVTQGKCP